MTQPLSLEHEDVRRILQIVDESSSLDEVDLTVDGLHLHVRRSVLEPSGQSSQGAPTAAVAVHAPQSAVHQGAPAQDSAPSPSSNQLNEVPEGMKAVRAPMLGSFYRSPGPGERPFVEVGQKVKADDTVCLIEVMKLFNSVKAGADGTVAEIRIADGQLVEYNQVLVVVKPAGEAR